MSVATVERLLDHFRQQARAKPRGPAPAQAIDAFEAARGIRLPDEFRAYLMGADGFDPYDGAQDDEGFSFWPLERLQSVATYEDGEHSFPGAESYLLFADYLDWSWGYALGLGDADPGVYMIGTADGRPHRVADSFAQFVERYLADDAVLYGPTDD